MGKVFLLPSFLPSFIPSLLQLGKFDTKFNGLISAPTERGHSYRRPTDGGTEAPENGILNFSPFLRLMPSSTSSVAKNLNQQKRSGIGETGKDSPFALCRRKYRRKARISSPFRVAAYMEEAVHQSMTARKRTNTKKGIVLLNEPLSEGL